MQVALPEEQAWGQWWQPLLPPAVAVIPSLGACGEVLGFGWVLEKENFGAWEAVEEVGSEYGSPENLEPLQESSQDRKRWSFVPVGKQVHICNDLK